MAATYRQIAPITYQRDVFPLPVTALAFDPSSDTLWTGLNSGIIIAFYTPQGMRGVTLPIGGGLAVKRIVASDSNIRAFGVASEGVGAWGKGGVNKWNHRFVSSPLQMKASELTAQQSQCICNRHVLQYHQHVWPRYSDPGAHASQLAHGLRGPAIARVLSTNTLTVSQHAPCIRFRRGFLTAT